MLLSRVSIIGLVNNNHQTHMLNLIPPAGYEFSRKTKFAQVCVGGAKLLCHLTLSVESQHSLDGDVDACKLVGLKHHLWNVGQS